MLIPGFLFVLYRKNKERCLFSILVWRPNLLRKESLRSFPGCQVVKTVLPAKGAWVQYLIKGQRSCMLQSVAKINKYNKKTSIKKP